MANNSHSKAYNVKVSIMSDRGFNLKIDRPLHTYCLLRGFLVLVILLTLFVNILFIFNTGTDILGDYGDDSNAVRGVHLSGIESGQRDEKDEGL